MKRLYDYECKKCHKIFEKFTDELIKEISCSSCDGIAERTISPTKGFDFKGSGFYQTDYK